MASSDFASFCQSNHCAAGQPCEFVIGWPVAAGWAESAQAAPVADKAAESNRDALNQTENRRKSAPMPNASVSTVINAKNGLLQQHSQAKNANLESFRSDSISLAFDEQNPGGLGERGKNLKIAGPFWGPAERLFYVRSNNALFRRQQ